MTYGMKYNFCDKPRLTSATDYEAAPPMPQMTSNAVFGGGKYDDNQSNLNEVDK